MADEYGTSGTSSTTTETTTESTTEQGSPKYSDYQSIPTIDSECEVVEVEVVEEVVCPTCEPNPSAPLIDWTKTDQNEPYLNERKCTYSICLTTGYEGTGGPGQLQSRLDEYVPEGVIKLLAYYNKAMDANTIKAATDIAGATDHFIPPRARLKMKVLIEIPANEFDALPSGDLVPEVDDTVKELEEKLELTEPVMGATINFGEFDQQMDKLIEGLKVYAKFQAIFWQTQKGSVRFPGGAPVNLMNEADYLRKMRPILYKWLRQKGWVIRDKRNQSRNRRGKLKEVEKLEFGFDASYKITKLTLYPYGTCAEEPTVFEGLKVYSLSSREPFNRPTTLNWLARIDECQQALIQRQGMMKWTEFTETFLYPTPTVNQGVDITSTVSAIASAATGQATEKDIEVIAKSTMQMTETEKEEAKTRGSWEDWQEKARDAANHMTTEGSTARSEYLLQGDSGSALAQSRRNRNDPHRASTDPSDPTYRGPQEIWDPKLNNGRGGYRMETAQEAHQRANAALAESDGFVTSSQLVEGLCDFDPNSFLNNLGDDFLEELFSIWNAIQYQFHNFICMTPEQRAEMLQKMKDANADAQAAAIREATRILVGFFEMINSLKYNLEEIKDIKDLYTKGLDEIQFCGLFDLIMAFIECLAQGFDLEELLEPLVAAALAALPPADLGKLFVGLDAEDQADIMAKVEAEIGSHTLPWESERGPDGQYPMDPSAESPFNNRPPPGSTGRNLTLSGGGLAKEKGAARQDPTAVTPKLQGIARKFEDAIEAKREFLQRAAETAADRELLEERSRLAGMDSDGDGFSDLEEAEAAGRIPTAEEIADDDGFWQGTVGEGFPRALGGGRGLESDPVSDSEVYQSVLADAEQAGALQSYFTTYEIEGYVGTTMSEIQASPGDYVTALQALLNRVNSATTITTSTVVKDDPFPDKSEEWKSLYYEEYARNYRGHVKDNCNPYYDKGTSEHDACKEQAAEYADVAAQTFADKMEGADKGRIGDPGPYGTRGSLGAALGSTVSLVIREYVKALLEKAREKGMAWLMDKLNEFPGASVIKKIIALLDCALPPLFDPPLLDFLNTLQIDFCNMVARIVLPEMPKLQWPNWKDFFKYLIALAKEIAIYIALRLLIWLLTKIVLMLFDSICAALEKLADAAMDALKDAACAGIASAGAAGGRAADSLEESGFCEQPPRNMLDMMKEAFCGPNATDEQAQEAANAAMRAMGAVTEADAAKMANTEAVNQLVADVSAVLTGGELTNLLLGEFDPVATNMVKEVVRTENPDYISVMGGDDQIANMFKNIGNLLPAEMKRTLRDQKDVMPALRPANPFLCSTPDDVTRFKDMRRNILMAKDGTTAEQADQQFDAMRGRALNDITEMAGILQSGAEAWLNDNMPPLIGEPDENGCIPENALIPRDPDEMMQVVGATNEKLFDIVGRAFYRDIIGERGCLSMVLSDVNGVPWRRHQRKSEASMRYSDYPGEIMEAFGLPADKKDEIAAHPFFAPIINREQGYYPKYVGQYFKDYLQDNKHNPDGYVTTTKFMPGELSVFGSDIVGSIVSGDFPLSSTGELVGTEENPFYTPGEKVPDLVLKFKDNNRGVKPPFSVPESMRYSDGFNLEYSSYVIDEVGGAEVTNTDNVYRLKVVEITNPLGWLPRSLGDMTRSTADLFPRTLLNPEELVDNIEDEKFVLTITGSLSENAEALRTEFDLAKDPELSPQVNLWNQYLISKFAMASFSEETLQKIDLHKPFVGDGMGSITHDKIMNTMLEYFAGEIAKNETAYTFGNTPGEDDDLNHEDKMYMGPEGFEDKPFIKYVMQDLPDQLGPSYKMPAPFDDVPRIGKVIKYVRDNQIMGTSNHPRMFFLNPAEFGGSWLMPPYYIEPPKYEGWLGFRDALVPEVDGKDPKRVPMCNFEDIKERVDELTRKMPDDPRLSENPECVREMPYSRILDRASAAGMEGPILGLIRIYTLEEMIKALPVFTKFKARIPEVLDYTYVEYILANMKEDFTERLGRKRGFLKGDALWYTFLEQCVQSFCRQIQLDGREVTPEVQQAIDALNELQENFKYPTEEAWRRARRIAGENPWGAFNLPDLTVEGLNPEVVFDREVTLFTKLKWYRRWHLLQAVKDTEHHANTIVRVLIEEQLEYMAKQFQENMKDLNMAPDVSNIYEYFVGESGFVAGSKNYSLDKDTQSSAPVHVYDVGRAYIPPETSSRSIEIRNPLEYYEQGTDKLDVRVKINNDGWYSVNSYESRFTTGEFLLEKYIRVVDKTGYGLDVVLPDEIINRGEHLHGVVNIEDWKEWIQSLPESYADKKLSDFFGNLEFLFAPDGQGGLTDQVTGVDGEMGIRYGLRLSYIPPQQTAEVLDTIFDEMAESDPSALTSLKSAAMYQNALYINPARINQEGLNILSTSAVDQDGNPTTFTTEQLEAVQEIWSGDRGTSVRETEIDYQVEGSKYIIPLVSAEYDAIDRKMLSHVDSIEEEMDLYCLGKDLIAQPEFEMLFQYVFPLNRLVSLMGIYTGMGFLMSIGEKTNEDDLNYSDVMGMLTGGYPTPSENAGEWQSYALRRRSSYFGASYDTWDFESLFPKTKKRLVRMFRSYFKSREFMSGGKDDDESSDSENSRKDNRDASGKKSKGRGGSRKRQRRRRARPFNKFGS